MSSACRGAACPSCAVPPCASIGPPITLEALGPLAAVVLCAHLPVPPARLRPACRTLEYSYEQWAEEIGGQRDWLAGTCSIPEEEVVGFRAPNFQINNLMGRVLADLGFGCGVCVPCATCLRCACPPTIFHLASSPRCSCALLTGPDPAFGCTMRPTFPPTNPTTTTHTHTPPAQVRLEPDRLRGQPVGLAQWHL